MLDRWREEYGTAENGKLVEALKKKHGAGNGHKVGARVIVTIVEKYQERVIFQDFYQISRV